MWLSLQVCHRWKHSHQQLALSWSYTYWERSQPQAELTDLQGEQWTEKVRKATYTYVKGNNLCFPVFAKCNWDNGDPFLNNTDDTWRCGRSRDMKTALATNFLPPSARLPKLFINEEWEPFNVCLSAIRWRTMSVPALALKTVGVTVSMREKTQ